MTRNPGDWPGRPPTRSTPFSSSCRPSHRGPARAGHVAMFSSHRDEPPRMARTGYPASRLPGRVLPSERAKSGLSPCANEPVHAALVTREVRHEVLRRAPTGSPPIICHWSPIRCATRCDGCRRPSIATTCSPRAWSPSVALLVGRPRIAPPPSTPRPGSEPPWSRSCARSTGRLERSTPAAR